MWFFGGTKFWYELFTDRWLCPSCFHWAADIIDAHRFGRPRLLKGFSNG